MLTWMNVEHRYHHLRLFRTYTLFALGQSVYLPVAQDIISFLVQAMGAGIASGSTSSGSVTQVHLVRVALLFFQNFQMDSNVRVIVGIWHYPRRFHRPIMYVGTYLRRHRRGLTPSATSFHLRVLYIGGRFPLQIQA